MGQASPDRREYMAAYNAARREQQAAYHREWRRRNADRKREYDRRYQRENRDALRVKSREWRRLNPDRQAAIAKSSRERRRAARAEWYRGYAQQDHVKAARRAREANRRARRRDSGAAALRPGDVAQRMTATYGGKCWICRVAGWEHVDHVKPLAAGGLHILSNLRPACAACNLSKGPKWPYSRPLVSGVS